MARPQHVSVLVLLRCVTISIVGNRSLGSSPRVTFMDERGLSRYICTHTSQGQGCSVWFRSVGLDILRASKKH